MGKKVKYEVVEVNITEDEAELDKVINEFKEVCRIYTVVLGKEPDSCKRITKDLIKDINKQIYELRESLQKDIKFP